MPTTTARIPESVEISLEKGMLTTIQTLAARYAYDSRNSNKSRNSDISRNARNIGNSSSRTNINHIRCGGKSRVASYRKNATSREKKTEEIAEPAAVQERTRTSRDANNKMVVSTGGNGMLQEHGHKRQVHYCKATAGAPETVETQVGDLISSMDSCNRRNSSHSKHSRPVNSIKHSSSNRINSITLEN
jgi:hypothetical protein